MRVLIRTDGDSRIGTGHVMRMLALAERVVERGGSVTFACVRLSAALETRIREAGHALLRQTHTPGSEEDAAWTLELAGGGASDWLITDGYAFDDRYHAALHAAGVRQLLVDDFGHCDHYRAQLVLNQNASADPAMYPRRDPQTELLLGARYAVLRGEFLSADPTARTAAPRADRILVTLGGADPDNTTATVIDGLHALDDPALQVKVVVGPSNPRSDDALRSQPDGRIELLRNVSNMCELMGWADLAIAGAGTTTWELAYMAVPTLLVVLADNQEALAASMARRGACIDLGWHHALTPEAVARHVQRLRDDAGLRERMGQLAHAEVDGQGGRRVLEAMERRTGELA